MKGKTTYFRNLTTELQNYRRAIPSLLVDLDILDQNIKTLQTNIHPCSNLRIVVKSLPSYELLYYIMQKTEVTRLMVFHQPFLSDLTSKLNDKADILLGKPMPIKTAKYFYQNLPEIKNNFNPFNQIQWLVDTTKRIEEYIALAKSLQKKIRLNVEIDVGLHRGGFANIEDLKKGLSLLEANKDIVTFSGYMGYDPHIVKLPSILRSQEKSLRYSNYFYEECKNLLLNQFPFLWEKDLTFNGAGSPTVHLHNNYVSPINDIAVGSCLVKPTTFDIPSLKNYHPASYIATPVLKTFKKATIPGIERFKRFFTKNTAFIYGGFWKADYCFPVGTTQNNLFGSSTNQTMINIQKKEDLKVDDFVFLRPHQSEFVFLQFGEILPLRNGKIQEPYTLLKQY